MFQETPESAKIRRRKGLELGFTASRSCSEFGKRGTALQNLRPLFFQPFLFCENQSQSHAHVCTLDTAERIRWVRIISGTHDEHDRLLSSQGMQWRNVQENVRRSQRGGSRTSSSSDGFEPNLILVLDEQPVLVRPDAILPPCRLTALARSRLRTYVLGHVCHVYPR